MSILVRTLTVLACVLLVGVLFQAPISVWADVFLPDYALVLKAWKEVVLVVLALGVVLLAVKMQRVRELARDKLLWLVGAIGALHIVLLLAFDNQYVSEIAGLVIDMRIYLAFAALYALVRLAPATRRPILLSVAAGVSVVMGFALLQVMVLPKDFLAQFGYSDETIKPYLTVDMNPDFVRVSSTLRGPNPLGALAVIVLSLVVVRMVQLWRQKRWRQWQMAGLAVLALCSVVALWYSYSRSALLAAGVSAVVLGVVWSLRTISIKLFAAWCLAAVLLLGGGIFATKDTAFVQNVVFHSNPEGGSEHKSDQGHAESLAEGIEAASRQPFGAGLGAVGSASLLTEDPLIIENQYLYIAHESGWLGLALQLWLFGWLLWRFWLGRQSGLALALLASGLGMAVIGLVLPVWADDTVGVVWWSLAGIALATLPARQVKAVARPLQKSKHNLEDTRQKVVL